MAHSPSPRPDAFGEPHSGRAADLDPAVSLAEWVNTLSAHGGGSLSADLALDLVLNDIAERICQATNAGGAAIALERGGEFVCRATSGENAPGLGITIDRDSGLSALCLQTRNWQLCFDTQEDPRVNAEASGVLGVRSILIYPIVRDQLIGLVEVFSPEAKAFSERDAEILKRFSREIADSVERAALIEPPPVNQLPLTLPVVDEVPKLEPVELSGTDLIDFSSRDPWTAFLTYTVILLALTLAWMIGRTGWRIATAKSNAHPRVTSAAPATQTATPAPKKDAVASPIEQPTAPVTAVGQGIEDVIVYQDGKVVYPRPADSANRSTEKKPIQSALRVPSDIAAEYVVTRVEPEYPDDARARGVQGPVVLDVNVGPDGSVESVAPISGSPLLTDAATQAVRQWRFQPFLRNGQAQEFSTRVTVNFRISAAN